MRSKHERRGAHPGVGCAVVALLTLASARSLAHPGDSQLNAGYALKAEGKAEEAIRRFEEARREGASGQLVSLELAYLHAATGNEQAARSYYAAAAAGPDPTLADRAGRELGAITKPTPPVDAPPAPVRPSTLSALDEAYRAKAAGDLAAAARAFHVAKTAERSQVAALELGYLAASNGDPGEAAIHFGDAAKGPDKVLGSRAERESALLPRHFHADIYADTYGWNRVSGETGGGSIVPMIRGRGLYRPVLSVPLELYASAQAVRDTASHGFIGGRLPQVYADNYATMGGGLRLRLWKRVELFGQVGPAVNLLDDGKDRVALDVRAGALAFLETSKCAPRPSASVDAGLWPCAELYAEGTFVSRFRNDVIGIVRPRAALGWLTTGPVLWQGVLEGRTAKDTNGDYWNNFVDGGAGHRWRLLAPFRLDLLVTANAGSYFGIASRDPAPSRLGYADVRGILTTYLEL